jgi:hypothetical protein
MLQARERYGTVADGASWIRAGIRSARILASQLRRGILTRDFTEVAMSAMPLTLCGSADILVWSAYFAGD